MKTSRQTILLQTYIQNCISASNLLGKQVFQWIMSKSVDLNYVMFFHILNWDIALELQPEIYFDLKIKYNFIFFKLIGKFYKSVFAIQAEVAGEFISVDPKVRKKTFQERLKELEEFMKVATEGNSTEFSRRAFGKGLFTFMKVIIYTYHTYGCRYVI